MRWSFQKVHQRKLHRRHVHQHGKQYLQFFELLSIILDIHSFVEAVLTDRIGEPGKKLHTGRSRNDQIALDERLYLRRMIPCIQNEILTLIKTLSEIASKNKKSLLTIKIL